MSAISNSWKAMTALGSSDPGTVSAASFPAPAALDPDEFRTWTLAKQAEYIEAKGGGTVTIGPAGGEQIKASIAATKALSIVADRVGAGTSQTVQPAFPSRPATSTEFTTIPDDLSPSAFLAWNRADQDAYLAKNGKSAAGDTLAIGRDSFEGRISVTLVKDVAIEGSVIFGTGQASDIPYYQLAGSSVGATSAFIMDQAEALFPSLDGATHVLPVADRPAGFYVDPATLSGAGAKTFLEDFTSWHSAYQLEYVRNRGTGGVLNIPTTGTPLMTAVVSVTDQTKLFIVNALQKGDFAKMSLDDQINVASTTGFQAISSKLGLAGIGSATVPKPSDTSVKTTASDAVADLADYISKKVGTNNGVVVTFVTQASSLAAPVDTTVGSTKTTYTKVVDIGGIATYQKKVQQALPDADRSYFTQQLAIMTEQLNSMGVVSPADIQKKLADIKDRFDRAFAFWDVKGPTTTYVNKGDDGTEDDHVATFKDVISRDDNATIDKGYQVFIAQEKRICELAEARMQIVRDNGVLFGQHLDVPSLVFRFQSLYNLQLEAQVVMETEEINQQNDLLKTYAAMQDLVNQTLSKFVKADDGSQFVLGKGNINDYQNIDEATRKLLSMFEDLDGAGQKHPLETLRGIARPLHDLFHQGGDADTVYDLNSYSHTQWTTLGTRLSEAVTIINQNSQIKMNDVNSLDKERNRHFELANSALSKMNEIITNIARA